MSDLSDVFIVGAPRSGTTWLQAVLSNHPSFASPDETFVFDALRQIRAGRWSAPGPGLQTVLSERQFDDWSGSLWRTARASILEAQPGATRVLEKTPDHAFSMDLIRRNQPGARFIHLQRHPHAVVRSLLEAAEGWGAFWAPSIVESAAALWRKNVAAALGASRPDDTLSVKYEDLRGSGSAWVSVLDFIGVDPDWPLPDRNRPPGEIGRFARPAAAARQWSEPPGFSFHSQSANARKLTSFERWYIDRTCRDLATSIGYDLATSHRLSALHELRRKGRRASRERVVPAMRLIVPRRATHHQRKASTPGGERPLANS